MRYTRSVLWFGLLTFVLSACTVTASTQPATEVPTATATEATPTSAPTPIPTATAVPESGGVELEADSEIVAYQGADVLGGELVKFSEVLAQGKPVLLVMWAPLCPSCRVQMPVMEGVYEEYRDRVLFVGLDIGSFIGLGSEDEARAVLDDQGITFPAGGTPDIDVLRDYEVLRTPSIYFVEPDGEILQKWDKILGAKGLREYLDELIEASGG
jgi:thiol-disulfide isomerase/thioredoxin